MKTITFKKEEKTINLADINERTPIFLIRNNEVAGMLILEKEGWITRIGGGAGSTGHYQTREKAIRGTYSLEACHYAIEIEIK